MRAPSRVAATPARRAATALTTTLVTTLLLVGALSGVATADDTTGGASTEAPTGTTGSTDGPADETTGATGGATGTDDGPADQPTGGTTEGTAGTTGGTTGAGAPPPRAPGPLRLLVEGDSLTQGFNGDYNWRYRLAREVTRQHARIDFVGSKRLPNVRPGFATAHYLLPFDSDHFATGASFLAAHASWITAEAARQRPDVVVLEAGLNDLRHGASPQQVDAYLRSWVAHLRAQVPRVKILLSPVLWSVDSTRPWLRARTAAYDALMLRTARELSTTQSPVAVADTNNGWSTRYTYDGTHPTPTGDTVIAQRVAEGLHRLGVLGPVARIARYTPWNRHLVPRVTVHPHSATLRWDRESVSWVRVLEKAPGRRERVLPRLYTHGTATVRLTRRGTYTVRLVAVRKAMTSTPGPVTRVVRHRTR